MVRQVFKVVRPDPVVRVGSQDGLSVLAVSEALDPDAFPRVLDGALGVALVKVAAVAAGRDLGAAGRPGNCGQGVFGRVGDLALDKASLHVPKTHLQ